MDAPTPIAKNKEKTKTSTSKLFTLNAQIYENKLSQGVLFDKKKRL